MDYKNFKNYLDINKIKYKSKKNGFPDLRYKNIINLYNEFNNNLNDTNNTNDTIDCPICYENINNNKVILSCNHTFCVKCFSYHIRLVNNCPLCREIICDKPNNNKKKLSNSEIDILIHRQLTTSYTERNNLNLHNYIFKELNKFDTLNKIKLNDQINIDFTKKEIFNNIFKEIIESIKDVTEDIENYYSS